MSKTRVLRDVQRLAIKAMANGGERIGTTQYRWNIAGDCSNPFTTEYHGRPAAPIGERRVVIGPGTQRPITVWVLTRCRTCDACANAKSNIWRHRIAAELSKSPRSWFGTFTLRPSAHYRFLAMARAREGAQGVDFDALPERERLKLVDKLIGRELQLWVKRLREAYRTEGGFLRYMIVCEQHKSGLPHYHALVHQKHVTPSLTHRMLETSDGAPRWPYGFTQWRLVKDVGDAAAYASKSARYASKSLAARVRASQGYGTLPSSMLITDR